MQLKLLIESAQGLIDTNDDAAEELELHALGIAAKLTESMLSRGDITEHIGDGNIPLMRTNHENHFRYIASTASVFDPQSFVEIVLWVVRTYMAKGFSLSYWTIMLPEAKRLMKQEISEAASVTAEPLYDWLLANLDALAEVSKVEHSFFERLSALYGGGHDC